MSSTGHLFTKAPVTSSSVKTHLVSFARLCGVIDVCWCTRLSTAAGGGLGFDVYVTWTISLAAARSAVISSLQESVSTLTHVLTAISPTHSVSTSLASVTVVCLTLVLQVRSLIRRHAHASVLQEAIKLETNALVSKL